jgi:hypothetical protein
MARARPETELQTARVHTAETLRLSREWREEQEQKRAEEVPVLDTVRRLEGTDQTLAGAFVQWMGSATGWLRDGGRA